MRAKLTVIKVEPYTKQGGDKVSSETLTLAAVYDGNNPEDNSYAEATPYAKLEIQIDNPVLVGQYKKGQKFAVSFEPISE